LVLENILNNFSSFIFSSKDAGSGILGEIGLRALRWGEREEKKNFGERLVMVEGVSACL
jgi:hypothetical protein